MTPLRPKTIKKFFKKTRQPPNLARLNKWRLNDRQNLNTHFRNTPFLTIFNLKKVPWE